LKLVRLNPRLRFAPLLAVLALASLLNLGSATTASAQDTSTTPFNAAEGLRIGILGGQVTLASTPGDGGANAFGLGAELSYRIEEKVALAVRYMGSSHTSASHREISFGAEYLLTRTKRLRFRQSQRAWR
jgi:hypothetical protein